jgi:hypothetical protein
MFYVPLKLKYFVTKIVIMFEFQMTAGLENAVQNVKDFNVSFLCEVRWCNFVVQTFYFSVKIENFFDVLPFSKHKLWER